MSKGRLSRRHAAESAAASAMLGAEPPGWVSAALGDLAVLQPGYPFKSKWFSDEGIRLLRGTNIVPGATRWEDVAYLPEDRFAEFEAYRLNSGDIVIAMDRPVISSGLKLAELSEADLPALLLQRVGRLKPADGVPAKFLYRYLEGPVFLRHIGVTATGTQLPHVSATDISTAPLLVPPLNEQRRIVEKIEALMERSRRAKEALDAIPPLLERFRQSVLAAAFRGDLTADWRAQNPDVEPADALLERIRTERRRRWEEAYLAKQRAKGKEPKNDKWKAKYKEPQSFALEAPWELPAGWSWVSIETVADVLLGRQRAPKYLTGRHSKPYLRVANISDGCIDLSDVKSMDFDERDFAKYHLLPGDILMSEGQSPELVGESAVYAGGVPDLCFQKTLHRLRMYESGPSPRLAQYAFHCLRLTGIFQRHASLTTSIAHLTLSRVKRVPFPLAPAAEQHIIEARVGAALSILSRLEQAMQPVAHAGEQLDRAILAKAFRGELVPQDPDDEPASVLLERIREERAKAAPKKKNRRHRRKKA